jgi:hypothetical protein
MSLSDLVEHTDAQNEAITGVTSGLRSGTPWCTAWDAFRNSFWGADLNTFQRNQQVERDTTDPVSGIELPDDHPIVTLPVGITLPWGWGLDIERDFLVRSEYDEAERAAVLSSGEARKVFVVGGQPGIGPPWLLLPLPAESDIWPGKSVFLLWLLVRRLAHRLPTVLQVTESFALLFHKTGISELTGLKGDPGYAAFKFSPDYRSRIWVLADSNESLLKPAIIFRHDSPFFMVNAVSPRSEHLDWLKKVNYEDFYMKTWSLSEIIQAHVDLSSTSSQRSRCSQSPVFQSRPHRTSTPVLAQKV